MRLFNVMIKNIDNQYIKYRIPFTKSESYLIKWLPKSQTKIHNHRGKNCDFITFHKLYECTYSSLKIDDLLNSREIKPFNIYHINDKIGYHQIFNFDNKIKWSIHRYY